MVLKEHSPQQNTDIQRDNRNPVYLSKKCRSHFSISGFSLARTSSIFVQRVKEQLSTFLSLCEQHLCLLVGFRFLQDCSQFASSGLQTVGRYDLPQARLRMTKCKVLTDRKCQRYVLSGCTKMFDFFFKLANKNKHT